MSILPKDRSFTAVLPEGRSSTANSGTNVAVLLGMNGCDSFPLLSALFIGIISVLHKGRSFTASAGT